MARQYKDEDYSRHWYYCNVLSWFLSTFEDLPSLLAISEIVVNRMISIPRVIS